MTNKEKLIKIAKKDTSTLRNIKYRIDNKDWLKVVFNKSLKIIHTMKLKSVTIQELNDKTGINIAIINILKGKKDITFKNL